MREEGLYIAMMLSSAIKTKALLVNIITVLRKSAFCDIIIAYKSVLSL